MNRNHYLGVIVAGLLATAGAAHAVPVKYVYGPGGRLAGQFEQGIATGYDYDPAGNITRRYVCEGACFVDGACWSEAAANPANACQACNAASADVAWTGLVGQACDDGDATTLDDACTAEGECVGTPPDPPVEGEGGGGGCCGVAGARQRPTSASVLVFGLMFGIWVLRRRRS